MLKTKGLWLHPRTLDKSGFDETYTRELYQTRLSRVIPTFWRDRLKDIEKKHDQTPLTVPNRFSFVFTPTHASWLNIIECLFSKMARSFLRGIRVSTKEGLKERILKYIDELNQMPVVFKWKYKMDEIPGGVVPNVY
jgi:hypothetical protein